MCNSNFAKANQLAYHYEERHTVAGSTKITVIVCGCAQYWRNEKKRRMHHAVRPRPKGTPRPNVLLACTRCGKEVAVQNRGRREAGCRGQGMRAAHANIRFWGQPKLEKTMKTAVKIDLNNQAKAQGNFNG